MQFNKSSIRRAFHTAFKIAVFIVIIVLYEQLRRQSLITASLYTECHSLARFNHQFIQQIDPDLWKQYLEQLKTEELKPMPEYYFRYYRKECEKYQ